MTEERSEVTNTVMKAENERSKGKRNESEERRIRKEMNKRNESRGNNITSGAERSEEERKRIRRERKHSGFH